MGYETPNIDRIANEGMLFTDYYGRAELHRRPCGVHHRPERFPHRPQQSRPAGRGRGHARRKTRPSPNCSSRWAMRPANSARTTSATATSILPTDARIR